MTNTTIEILSAEPRTIKAAGQEFHVKEIAWLDLLRFVELLSTKAGELLTVTPDGKAQLDLAKLPQLIAASSDLSALLVAVSTDLKPEAAGALPARVFLRVIEQALEMNLTEDFIAAGKAVASRLQAALPVQARAQLAASSSS